jgi:hypothetical protein
MLMMKARLNQSHAFHSVRLHAVLIVAAILALGFVDLTSYSKALAIAVYTFMIFFVEFAIVHIIQLRHRRKHPIDTIAPTA